MAVTLKLTAPVPFPFAPDVIVSQEICSVAVHVHPAAAATEKLDVPAPAGSDRLDGVTSNVHASPCWTTSTVCPAIVIVADRPVVPVWFGIEKVTVPFPLPFAPPVIVIQLDCSVAVHVQPAGAVTVNVDVPPAAASVRWSGVTAYVQPCPACVTATDWPAIVRLPFRWDVAVCAPALKVTVPSPLPDAPPVIVIHEVCVVAVHAQVCAAETANVELPPPAGTDRLDGDTLNVQAAVPKLNVFDASLRPAPPGPIAVTRAT